MEYVFVNDWYIYWFATVTLAIWTSLACLVVIGTAFISTVVYDIYKQVNAKWKVKK